MMETVLITGANRGIGLALSKEFLQQGYKVLATCRTESTALENLSGCGELSIHLLDVAEENSVVALAEQLADQRIGNIHHHEVSDHFHRVDFRYRPCQQTVRCLKTDRVVNGSHRQTVQISCRSAEGIVQRRGDIDDL